MGCSLMWCLNWWMHYFVWGLECNIIINNLRQSVWHSTSWYPAGRWGDSLPTWGANCSTRGPGWSAWRLWRFSYRFDCSSRRLGLPARWLSRLAVCFSESARRLSHLMRFCRRLILRLWHRFPIRRYSGFIWFMCYWCRCSLFVNASSAWDQWQIWPSDYLIFWCFTFIRFICCNL